jgi:hypothetical protein
MPPPTAKTTQMPVACFAPALTDETLAAYRTLVAGLPASRGDVKDAMAECLAAVEAWWALPESKRKDVTRFTMLVKGEETAVPFTPLEKAHQASLFDLIPWPYELDAMQALFDTIPAADKALRDAAFHLLWHARELCLDREPATQDALKG